VICKREFPQLVQLHEKNANSDLTVITVSLDEPAEKGIKEKVLGFLTKQKAVFTNVMLDENQDFWQKKFHFEGPPCVFVFDREGKWKQFKNIEGYEEVEKYVAKCLMEK
jgi:hypothetical protein